MPNKFTIEVRNTLYERVGLIEQYTRFEAVVRYCDVGSWTLSIDASLPESNLISEGGGIIVWTPGLVEPLFSGPVKEITREWSDQFPAVQVTFTGKTDEQWLHERVIFPNPALTVNGQDKDRETGARTAAGALSYLASRNIGAQARAERVHPYLTVDVADFGPTINVSARFDVLGEYLSQIATIGRVGFKVVQEGTGIRMKIFAPVNRTDDVIFSPDLGNLADYKYSISAPEATWVAVAAQGEGKFRWIKEFGSVTATTEFVNNNDPRIVYDSGWTFSFNRGFGDYLNDAHHTTTLGAEATFTFTGTGIQYYTERESTMKNVQIFVDGVLMTTVDCSTAGARQVQVLTYNNQALAYGSHTITIKNASAGQYALIDFFKVTTLPFQTGGEEWRSLNAERFVDRRDIPVSKATNGTPINPGDSTPVFPDVLAQLDQAGIEALTEAVSKASLSVTPIDTEQLQFGRDYSLGDIVAVSIDGVTITDVLREVKLSDDTGNGPEIKPTIGSPDATADAPAIYRVVRKMRQAIRKIETRL